MSEPWHYIVLLGAAIAVIAYAMPRAKSKAAADAAKTKDMEQLLEQYMFTAEQEHEALVQLVKEAQQSSKQTASAHESKVSQLETQLAALMNELEQQKKSRAEQHLQAQPAAAAQNLPAQQESIEEKPAPTSLEQRYEQLFQLHNSGKSIEAIAKKLQLNKGEVQLIIQLAKQEASARG
ncbi:DUF6115 domain-containing protein [Paenibacillus sp. GXUN7292]|uniref:DUF6115 domain-containing protein n=1 Tax=Paenibacillus sp. GXUN7292 TaxID=3422499 RepID=UPI003D7EBD5C